MGQWKLKEKESIEKFRLYFHNALKCWAYNLLLNFVVLSQMGIPSFSFRCGLLSKSIIHKWTLVKLLMLKASMLLAMAFLTLVCHLKNVNGPNAVPCI